MNRKEFLFRLIAPFAAFFGIKNFPYKKISYSFKYVAIVLDGPILQNNKFPFRASQNWKEVMRKDFFNE